MECCQELISHICCAFRVFYLYSATGNLEGVTLFLDYLGPSALGDGDWVCGVA